MTVSDTNAVRGPLERSGQRRPARELVLAAVFGPLAAALVKVLLPLRIPPPAVVLANAAAGIVAALAIWQEAPVAAALLLQLKTLLDNADGRLARATGRTTLLGRYLDTEADLAVNFVLFAALAAFTGEPWLAAAAFVALTLVLSVDFNVAELYRATRFELGAAPVASGGRVERALARVYALVFAPQDRFVSKVVNGRLERVLEGEHDAARRSDATLAYHDRTTLAVLANLGLSTQLAALGVCLAVGAPTVYLWLVLAQALALPFLQLRRERLARRALVG